MAANANEVAAGYMSIYAKPSGNFTSTLSNSVNGSKMAMAIGKKLVAGLAALEIGQQIVDVISNSLSNYADYEQLVGGIDTLFKGSSGKVQKYATEAYKTTGQSANEYMEQVTSFSASLLQSVGGNTKKAAESANQAMVDMADNANKMGTPMEAITNAYQGFAKQNYTMLDNLKLGYGGTKSEMERLLKDAQKLSGQKYDISSLDDVYEAIHVVQTEMGITGTTAEEAASTISGSTASMQSAWQNLLTGMGDPNADVQELTDQFLDALDVCIQNAVPVIGTIALHLVDALGHAIETGLNNVLGAVFAWIGEFAGCAIKAGSEFIGGIVAQLNGIPARIKAFLDGALRNINNFKTHFVEAGKNIIKGLVNGIGNAKQWVIDKIQELCSNAEKAIKSFFGIKSPSRLMMKYGNYISQGLGIGISKGSGYAVKAMQGVSNDVASAVSLASGSVSVGGDITTGVSAAQKATASEITSLTERIDRMAALMESYYPSSIEAFRSGLTMDGKKVAKAIARPMDEAMGSLYARKAKGLA